MPHRMRAAVLMPSRTPVAAGAIVLVGCASALPHPPYAPQATSALIQVAAPPPPGRVEEIPARPPGASWVDGEWEWRRGRWAWEPGRWIAAPAGATFSPWAFVRGPDGTLWYAPGTWHDAQGGVIDTPPPIAAAKVDDVEVVSASGEVEDTGPTLRLRSQPKAR